MLILVKPEIAKYVHFALMADGFGKTQLNNMAYGMGRPVLSLEDVQNITIPLPPIFEQYKICEIIENNISFIDEIEKSVNLNIKNSKKLKQSILKKAFEGKPIPQDPTDEPASVLLERIKEEKSKREEN